jgi:hypothetical protein
LRGIWTKPGQTHLGIRSLFREDRFERLANIKATQEFELAQCESVFKKHFPSLYRERCLQERSSIIGKDRVEVLAYSYLEESEIARSLDQIAVSGESSLDLWSDDYWRTRWGQTSYRYSEKKHFPNYATAIADYAQPAFWESIANLPAEELRLKTTALSPAEKYDLAVGDGSFALTNQQKQAGKYDLTPSGDVEPWMGLCHGWAAASVMVSAPTKSLSVTGLRETELMFYPADVRALVTLHWANANHAQNFIGGRCRAKNAEIHPNGRLKKQSCFDTNPATFHLALANLIGLRKHSFVMDVQFDYEVWNQPLKSYKFTYFNPLDPAKQSAAWKDVAVDYDDVFKTRDRFQNPKTRGVRKGSDNDDSAIKKMVGVIATVTYLVEFEPPPHIPSGISEDLERVQYTYDLELQEINAEWIPSGGEWHNNAHPDFLWVPRARTFASSPHDKNDIHFDGKTPPSEELTQVATQASTSGLPLCRVLKHLVHGATGIETSYRCP